MHSTSMGTSALEASSHRGLAGARLVGADRRATVISVDLLDRFRSKYPFPLDDFQVEAIRAIGAGQSVIVSAPTGAGKTLVAEFAIELALQSGKRLAYTTPLKALSNQKFGDFTRAFGEDVVGILTGDVKVNPRGRLLVMTTEILRNMFYAGGLDDLGYVVLDECHYMGDEGRGTVWEEIIVNAPRDVQLVALSATVANVKEIADWISIVHGPIVAIEHPERPVPLSYAVADLAGEIHDMARVRTGHARPVGDESRGPDARGRWYTRRVVSPVTLIEALQARSWLPAIYFIFSRAGCERALDDVLAEGQALLTREQRREVDLAIHEALRETPSIGESPLNQGILQGLRLGVGLHHAGILPSLKRLIETLFERGLCKVVFATETMALGIHMPARSVVLQGLTKRSEHGFRALLHNELTQMAGRAGRRGIDAEGQCVIALDVRDGVEDILRVVDGAPEPIASQFKLGYGSSAMLLATEAPPEVLRRRIEASFGQYQNLKRIRDVEADASGLERSLAAALEYAAPCGDFPRIGRYRQIRQEVEQHRQALGRGARRGERTVLEAEVGRLALVRRKGAPALALILGIHSIRGHRAIVDALLPHGAVVRVKAGVIKRIFWATPPLHVPQDRGRDGRGLRHLAEVLSRLSLAELIDRERAQGPEAALAASECHRCPWGATTRCDQAWRDVEHARDRLGRRRHALESLRGAYWQEFLRVVEVLEQFGAVREGTLQAKGRLVAGLRHENELLVAEAVSRGILAELSLAEAAAVCSALLEESRSGDPNIARSFLRSRPRIRRKLEQLAGVADAVAAAQRARHLGMPVAINAGFVPAVFRWASGEDGWANIVETAFGGHEGDLIRAMRRLIDLLRQFAESGEVGAELGRLCAQAARVVDRGIVLESALI
jgi:superfamily II RNA helicase